MSQAIVLLFVFLNVLASSSSTLRAEELTLSGTNVGLAQMKTVLSQASEGDFRIAKLAVSVVANRTVFDYVIEDNTDGIPWIARLNATDAMLVQAEQELADRGYTRFIEDSVELNGNRLSSVVWHKIDLPRPLILPDQALPESGDDDPRTARVDEAIKSFLIQHNVAGATVAIGVRGRLVYSRGYGYADVHARRQMLPNTELRIASISKTITAAVVLRLIQQHRLDLEAKVLPFLRSSGLRISNDMDERWASISVRHLLEHSGGWDRELSGDPLFKAAAITRKEKLRRPVSRRDVIQYQLSRPLDFEPGLRQAYSNFGYLLLGLMIEVATEQEYEEAVQMMLLRLANMESTRIGRTRVEHRGDHEAAYYMQNTTTHLPFWSFGNRRQQQLADLVAAPDGQWDVELLGATAGWVSTAPDLVRFLAAVDPHGQADESLIPAMSRRPVNVTPQNESWLGYGWSVREDKSVEGGVEICQLGTLAGTSSLLFRSGDGVVCCVLFNTDESIHGRLLAKLFQSVIYDVLLELEEWPSVDLFAQKSNAISSN